MDSDCNNIIKSKIINCIAVDIIAIQCLCDEKMSLNLFMTHFQKLFIKNLRFWRKKRGISQLKLSEMINISPNYLNAVENGKNFPSPEVIQHISDILELMPYQLFLEHPMEEMLNSSAVIDDLMANKQRFIKEISELIKKYQEI
jgi:transcriptional regulator with XRE-family HTH domain